MNIFLSQKELEILKNYVEEMLRLFEESDMVKEDETLYLSGERLEVSKKDFKALKKKLQIYKATPLLQGDIFYGTLLLK